MLTHLRFEFKTAAWRTYLALAVALLGLLAFTIVRDQIPRNGFIFYTAGDRELPFLTSNRKAAMTKMVVAEAATEKARLQKEERTLTAAPQARRLMTPLVAALRRGDYAAANRLTLAHLTADPELTNQLTYLQYFTPDVGALLPKDLRALLDAWLRLAPDRLLQVDLYTSALNLVTRSLNLTDVHERRAPTLLIYGLLLVAIAATTTAFFTDERRRPAMLDAVAPLAPNTKALLRALVTWLIINAGLLAAVGLVVSVLALAPAHDLGLWRFPIQIPHKNLAQIIPLWALWLRYLGLFNLWFLLFISLAHLVRQITKDASVAMFVLALVPFAGYFHLLDHLPGHLVDVLPSQYVNLPALVNHQLSYVHTAGWFVALVFAGWIIGLWLAATALAAVKRRVRVPLVTND
ncbi:hypothetical protein [Lacticaseibacillus kribbianus]|uniref:hypothetical protein n=1 Tax=Lacticaseibacillus kribbianus TaxID=2926292 RepID=UPI001CD55E1B|nr:hypothetical protein [Lacticaseibacillus kribbianus]